MSEGTDVNINIRNLEMGEAVELGGSTRLANDGEVLISVTADNTETPSMAMVLQHDEAIDIGKLIAKAGWRGRASVVRTRREMKKLEDS